MTEKISDGRGAEVPEVTPANRIQRGTVTARLARAEPQIPIHTAGSRIILRASGQSFVPTSGAGPGMDFSYVTDGAVPDQLASLADEIAE